MSFRGPRVAREPGTHEHRRGKIRAWPVIMGSGPGPCGPSRNDDRIFRQPARPEARAAINRREMPANPANAARAAIAPAPKPGSQQPLGAGFAENDKDARRRQTAPAHVSQFLTHGYIVFPGPRAMAAAVPCYRRRLSGRLIIHDKLGGGRRVQSSSGAVMLVLWRSRWTKPLM